MGRAGVGEFIEWAIPILWLLSSAMMLLESFSSKDALLVSYVLMSAIAILCILPISRRYSDLGLGREVSDEER